MADVKIPKRGEFVDFVTNKGIKVTAIVTEAPPRPGLDKGVISGLFVLDPTGTYFRKDVEYRDGPGGWMWADHSADDAMAAREAANTSAAKIAPANADGEEVDADKTGDDAIAERATTKTAGSKKKK